MNANKKKMLRIMYIYIAIIFVLVFFSKTIYNFSLPKVTAVLPKSGKLTKELEAYGVVSHSETFDINSDVSGQIEELFIKPGDLISADTVIAKYKMKANDTEEKSAELKFRIERIQNQKAALYLDKTAQKNELSGLVSESESKDIYSYQTAIEDAKCDLQKKKDELVKLQSESVLPFDDYTYQAAIKDAEINLNRRTDELKAAEKALVDAKAGKIDDYALQKSVSEAAITLDRKKTELINAENALNDTKANGNTSFDDYTYQNAINTAKTAYDRSLTDYNSALASYSTAAQQYNNLPFDADETTIAEARKKVDDAQKALDTASRTLDDANSALNKSYSDLDRARASYDTTNNETKKKAITAAEQAVSAVKSAVDDAQRAYDNAVMELNKGTGSVIDVAVEKAMAAEIAAEDAQRTYDKAIEELKLSNDKSEKNTDNRLLAAENAISNAETALERAEKNLDMAISVLNKQNNDMKESISVEMQKTDLALDRADIDLQEAEAALNTLTETNSSEPIIQAALSGTVITVEKRKGSFVNEGEKIASVGVDNHLFTTEFSCPKSDRKMLNIGDEATVSYGNENVQTQASICEITPEGEDIKVALSFESEFLRGGEYVSISFSKQTKAYDTLVPNETIVREGTSNYVWVVRSRNGSLGKEYYCVKLRVFISDSDFTYTAITKGIDFLEPVITGTDKDLMMNNRVIQMD